MAMTLEELQILITAETASLRAELEKVKKELTGLDRSVKSTVDNIKNAFSKVKTTLAALGIGATIRSATKEAMAFEAAVQQIQRLMGSSAGAFQAWANENAAAFGMARAEAIRYGAVYANLLSAFTDSTAQTAQYTRDLLQTSAVVASYTGRTMEDVMERIRSGLLGNTEAIEDLGINVNIAMIEATQAFQQFANGKSWEQLDFRTQQTIRYFAILEQAARKYGNELAQNTATRHAAFIAQLKDLQLALGQAFLPIYNAVLPALTQLAAALAEVMRFVAAFLQALFGYKPQNTQNQARQITRQTQAVSDQAAAVGSLGNAYEKAGKKAKLALADFDEVHQLNTGDTESGSSTGIGVPTEGIGAGIDGGIIGDALSSVSEKARELAERLRNILNSIKDAFINNKDLIVLALEAMALNMLRTALNAGKLSEAAKLLSGNLAKLREAIKNTAIGRWFAETFLPWLKESPLISLFKAIQEGAIKAAEVVKTKAGEMAKALDFSKIFAAFRESAIVQKVVAIFESIKTKIKEFTVVLKENAIVRFFAEAGSKIAEFGQMVGGKFAEIGALIARLAAPFRVVWEWIVKTFEWVLKLWEVLTKIPVLGPLLQLAGRFAGILGWILLIIDAAKAAIWVFQNWENIPEIIAAKWDEFKQRMIGLWEEIKTVIAGWWDDVKTKTIDIWDNITGQLGEKWESIKAAAVEKWREIGTGISAWWNNVKTNTVDTWNSIAGWLGEKWGSIKTAAAEKWQGIANVVTDWWGKIHTKTTEVWESTADWLGEKWESIKKAVADKWEVISSTIVGWWDNIYAITIEVWESITGWLGETWEILKTTIWMTWEGISNTIFGWWNQISTITTKVWNTIFSWLSTTWENIKTTASIKWTEIKTSITSYVEATKTFIETTWNEIASGLEKTWNGIKSTAKEIWTGIKETIKGVINGIIDMINGFIRQINKIKIEIPDKDWIPKKYRGAKIGFNIPKITPLARGGIIEQPTLALIGEAGKEAVVPLENTSFVTAIRDAVASGVGNVMLSVMQMTGDENPDGRGGDIIIQIDGTALARVLYPYMEREQKRLGATILQPIGGLGK